MRTSENKYYRDHRKKWEGKRRTDFTFQCVCLEYFRTARSTELCGSHSVFTVPFITSGCMCVSVHISWLLWYVYKTYIICAKCVNEWEDSTKEMHQTFVVDGLVWLDFPLFSLFSTTIFFPSVSSRCRFFLSWTFVLPSDIFFLFLQHTILIPPAFLLIPDRVSVSDIEVRARDASRNVEMEN